MNTDPMIVRAIKYLFKKKEEEPSALEKLPDTTKQEEKPDTPESIALVAKIVEMVKARDCRMDEKSSIYDGHIFRFASIKDLPVSVEIRRCGWSYINITGRHPYKRLSVWVGGHHYPVSVRQKDDIIDACLGFARVAGAEAVSKALKTIHAYKTKKPGTKRNTKAK